MNIKKKTEKTTGAKRESSLNNEQTSMRAAKMQKRPGAADFSRAFKDARGIKKTDEVPNIFPDDKVGCGRWMIDDVDW